MTPEQARDLIHTPAWNAWLEDVLKQYVAVLQAMHGLEGEQLLRLVGSVKLLEQQIERPYAVAGVESPLKYLYSGEWLRHWLGQEPTPVPTPAQDPDEASVWFDRPPRSSGPI